MICGAQFYTIRKHCTTPEDLLESMKKVADIGYTSIQLSGVCAYDPQWMKEKLKETGLKCAITHNPRERLIGEPEEVTRENLVYGCKYIGLGSFAFNREEPKDLEDFFEIFTPVAGKIKKAGGYFMYHNHAKEFFKYTDKTIMACLAERMPADLMGFTLDTYWVQVGGADPAQWAEKLAGRIPCVHLKDAGYKQIMLPVGEGNINFDRFFAACEKGGTEYLLVEQDDCNGEDEFDCLRRSYECLKSFGLR